MKYVFIIVTVLTLASETSFAMGRGRSDPTDTQPTPTPTQVDPPSNEDTHTGGITVKIQGAKNFSAAGIAKLEAGRALLERVMNSEEFKQMVLHHTYNGQETYVQNNGLTNLQIYNLITNGNEKFPVQTAVDHTVDLWAERYTSNVFGRNVIGYTNPSTHTIFMNSWYFDSAKPVDVAGNMIHEWLHKMGFDHDFDRTDRRPFSVPYAIGDMIDRLMSQQN